MSYRRFEGGELDDHRPKRDPPELEPVEARFECGCAASDVEWSREDWNPNVYAHHPRIEASVRVCPIHGKPVAA